MAEKKIAVAAVAGPTASGKSRLGVALAKKLGGEIISADSMQIYQEMSISTAKPTLEEMEGVPHHLVDFLPITASFSVADYTAMAKKCIDEIASRGRLPLLVGGTGLYIRSLLGNIQFTQANTDPSLRRELLELAESQGPQALWEELRAIDPESAERIHPNNVVRTARAIEIYRASGVTMSEQIARSRQEPSPYNACIIGLDYRNRAILYRRIDSRVDAMLEAGLLNEARRVLGQGASTALQAIGCKELKPFLDGVIPLEDAIENVKRETRRYAKRQLTWFRREEGIHWLHMDSYGALEEACDAAALIIEKELG